MELKVLTYNIDCLPQNLDLKDLPWWLQPVRWIYKLVKKTDLIRINDNECKPYDIGRYLLDSDADIIALQEDFNYHTEMYYSTLKNIYNDTFHTGKIDLKNIKWFPYPRFKADGMNLFAKKENVHILLGDTIKWNKSSGYFSHANDLLTTKGFRFYDIMIDGIFIDVYNIHMDADFYNGKNNTTKDLEARRSQFDQLVSYIKDRKKQGFNNPIIIMGDTNSYNKYDWDVHNIKTHLIHELDHEFEFSVNEALPHNFSDCDRIFYINNVYSDFELRLKECYFDVDTKLSDHFPLIATFKIVEK